MQFKVDVIANIPNPFDYLIDDNFKIFAHKTLGDLCEPYVPMLTGVLDQSREATPEYLRYPGPYAHYQYEARLMVDPVTGSAWARKNVRKVYKEPTQLLVHSSYLHPLATRHWDKVAMETGREKLIQTLTDYLKRKARNG